MADLAFIATHTSAAIDPAALVAAGADFGLNWTVLPETTADGTVSFEADGVAVAVTPIAAMHPDIPHMPVGPTGADPAELLETLGHIIVTATGLRGSELDRDCKLARFTTVIMAATDPLGVMLGHNSYFHRADVFTQLVIGNAAEGRPPLPLLISVTVAGDGTGRMSFLSHGLHRYGKEDLYITCSVEGQGAVPFVYDMISWFFELDEELPTGDAIGRDETESFEVQRVPSPAEPDRTVVRLDLD